MTDYLKAIQQLTKRVTDLCEKSENRYKPRDIFWVMTRAACRYGRRYFHPRDIAEDLRLLADDFDPKYDVGQLEKDVARLRADPTTRSGSGFVLKMYEDLLAKARLQQERQSDAGSS